MIFREVQRIASQLFQRNNTGVVRQIQQIDTTGMQPVLAQYTLAVQSDSVRLLEELVKQIYQTLIEPTSTKFRLQTYSTKVHATLQDNPSAAGTHCVFDSDENFDSFDRFAGVRMQLELNTLQPTSDSITDLRTREDLRVRIQSYYTLPDGSIDMVKKDNEAAVAEIIRNETNANLFSQLKQMLTDNSNHCANPAALTKYIRTWKHGDKSLPDMKTHEIMHMQDITKSAADMVMAMLNEGNSSDDEYVNAAVRKMLCAACGEEDNHPTSCCPNQACVYKMCKKPAGKGHVDKCPRYKAWLRDRDQHDKAFKYKAQSTSGTKKFQGRFRKAGPTAKVNAISDEDVVDTEDAMACIAIEKVAIMKLKRETDDDERIAFLEAQAAELDLLAANMQLTTTFDRACLRHGSDAHACIHMCRPPPTLPAQGDQRKQHSLALYTSPLSR